MNLFERSDEASRALSQYKDGFPGMGVSIIKIRWLWDRLNFITGIPIVVRRHRYIETAPSWLSNRAVEDSCSYLSLALWLICQKLGKRRILRHWGQITSYVVKHFGHHQSSRNRKWQDYVYIQCEYKSTKQKIKHLLREGKIR